MKRKIIFLVCGKLHSAEKCKRRALWEFLNIHSFANRKKIEGGPLETFKKIAEKISQSRNNLHKQIFGQGRDSNPRPSAWQTSKKPN